MNPGWLTLPEGNRIFFAEGRIYKENVIIPAGTYLVGAEKLQGENVHEVTFTKTILLNKQLVTNEEFCGFLNKSKVTAEGKLITAKKDEIIVVKSIRQSIDSGEFLPVIQKYGLSAEDISQLEGLGVFYDGQKWAVAKGYEHYPVTNVTYAGARAFLGYGELPTEAQWECTCQELKRCKKKQLDKLVGQESLAEDKNGTNAKFYKMLCDIKEWCADYYDEYPVEAVTDPHGPISGEFRVVRALSSPDTDCCPAPSH